MEAANSKFMSLAGIVWVVSTLIFLAILVVFVVRYIRMSRLSQQDQSLADFIEIDYSNDGSTVRAATKTRRYVPGNAQHIGKREEQQDAFGFSNLSDPSYTETIGAVAVLADGMGGMTGGREAANAAVDAFLQTIEQVGNHALSANQIQSILRMAVAQAHEAVLEVNERLANQGSEAELGAGTTICAVWLHEMTLHWVSVGDSRIYVMQSGAVSQLTVDDNYGMELDEQARQGLISAEEAYHSNERHMLTAYLGSPEFSEQALQVYSLAVAMDDRVLLCSDGVYGSVSEEELQLATQYAPQEAVEYLIQTVLHKQKKYQDNMTAVILGMEVTS